MWKVVKEKAAEKELAKAPKEIQKEFEAWVNFVETSGPSKLRNFPGYRDHSLKGEWIGARSSSLSDKWRVIYVAQSKKLIVLVFNITPHDYRRKL